MSNYNTSTYTGTNYYDKAVLGAMLISDSYTKTETYNLLLNEVNASNGIVSDSLTINGATGYALNVINTTTNLSDWWMVANFRQEVDNAGSFIKFERSGTTDFWNMGVFYNSGYS